MYSRVYVEITNSCNLSCSFCPGTSRKPKFLTIEAFREIVGKLEGVTQYLYLHVMGEPLLHPALPEFIHYATDKGFRVVLTTNGTLLKKREKELLASGVYKINISLHSFEDGTQKEQVAYLSDCISFADRASTNGILVILRLWNEGTDEGRNDRTIALLREKYKEEWAMDARGARIRPKLHLEYGKRFKWPDTKAQEYGNDVFCYGLKDHFAILSDGAVIPCCLDREGVITLGNIFESSIEEILSSDRAKQMADGFKHREAVEDLCKKCGYARRF
ncbi:MAG: radical SAM protein [Lachnospiraceae bacterium]|nr:radical SAM protein [Lachnospiraceae bacterium]